MENSFLKAARSFYKTGMVAGRAETFILDMLTKIDDKESLEEESDIVISDLETGEECDDEVSKTIQDLTCSCCHGVAVSPPIYKCLEDHLVCYSCSTHLVRCRACGVRLLCTRDELAEEMSNIVDLEVENTVKEPSMDILIIVSSHDIVGSDILAYPVFK